MSPEQPIAPAGGRGDSSRRSGDSTPSATAPEDDKPTPDELAEIAARDLWDEAVRQAFYQRFPLDTLRDELAELAGEEPQPGWTLGYMRSPNASPEAKAALAAMTKEQRETQAFQERVAFHKWEQRARDQARQELAQENRPTFAPWDAGTLAEQLAKPLPPAARVEGLIPWEASTVVVAQRKSGKTTLSLNLARSLTTGEALLGRFTVRELEGNVGLLNYEVSGHTLAAWAEKAGIPSDRLFIVNLRGTSNPFADDYRRAELAALLRSHEVETLIVDPFGRAYSGDSQNDAGQVQRWLMDLDEFARSDVGARDVILNVHAGWNGERARGSSALEDWADSLIYLSWDEETDRRYIRAMGRDVELPEDQTSFDPDTLRVTLSGMGSRRVARAVRRRDELVDAIQGTVEAQPGINTSDLTSALRQAGHSFQKGDVSKAAKNAADLGLIRREQGPGNSTLHYPAEQDDLSDPEGQVAPSGPGSPRGASSESPRRPPMEGATHSGALKGKSPRSGGRS